MNNIQSTDSEIRFFGANPAVVAQLDEIHRIAAILRAIGALLESARQELSAAWIQDPSQLLYLGSIRRELDASSQLVESLARDCEFAAVGYLTVESQILGAFMRYADSPLIPTQARMLFTAGLAGAALGGLGNPFGSLATRAATSTLIANRGGGDPPKLAERVAAAIAGTGLITLPEAVGVVKLSDFSTSCPTSALELAERQLELGQSSLPLIRIDTVTGEDGRSVFLYLPGTQTWGVGGENPLDMQSNFLAMAGEGLAASEVAAISALRAVGFSREDRLILVGHSQGGLIAKNLSLTFESQVRGVVTFGAPILASQLPSVPALVFEHVNDPIPALASMENKYPAHALTISRQYPSSSMLQSHLMESYRDTSKLADSDSSSQLISVERQIFADVGVLNHATCTSHLFEIRRETNLHLPD